MSKPIVLEIEGVRLEGHLEESSAAEALAERLPLEVKVQRWGDEYYGSLGAPLGHFEGETAQIMAVGELAYWDPGNALCLFFGPTPASLGGEPRAASPVHRIGQVEGDWVAVKALGPSVVARLMVGGVGE